MSTIWLLFHSVHDDALDVASITIVHGHHLSTPPLFQFFSFWKVNCKYCDAMEVLPSLVLNHVWIFYIKICASCEPFVFWSLPVQQRVTCQWAWIACEALCHHHGHQSHLCPGSLVTFLGPFVFCLVSTICWVPSFKLKTASQNFPYKYLQLIQNQNK